MAKVKVTEFDIAKYLQTEEDIANYLSAVLEENDSSLLTAAIGDVAKARGMTEIAKNVGMSRTSLYKSLSKEGNPEFSTIINVMHSLGVKLSISPLQK